LTVPKSINTRYGRKPVRDNLHTLARHGIVYDQPLAVTQRQQGAAIEGALRQRNAPIRRVFSDTHGYSAFGMTLGKFEGIDLCPRLRSFKDRRLHIPRGRHIEVPESLKNVCIADVSLETITKGWTQLSNIADAASGRPYFCRTRLRTLWLRLSWRKSLQSWSGSRIAFAHTPPMRHPQYSRVSSRDLATP
jgi:TnpA family transposase